MLMPMKRNLTVAFVVLLIFMFVAPIFFTGL